MTHGRDHRVEVDRDAAPKLHGANVERAHVGFQVQNMLQPSFRREHQGAGATDRGIIIALHPSAARAGRDVQDHFVILRANEAYHLAIIVQRL